MTALENNQCERGGSYFFFFLPVNNSIKKQTNKHNQLLLVCRSGISDVFAARRFVRRGRCSRKQKPSCPCARLLRPPRCLFGHLRRNFPPRHIPRRARLKFLLSRHRWKWVSEKKIYAQKKPNKKKPSSIPNLREDLKPRWACSVMQSLEKNNNNQARAVLEFAPCLWLKPSGWVSLAAR